MKPQLRWTLLAAGLLAASGLLLFGKRDDGSQGEVVSATTPGTERARSGREANTDILELHSRTADSASLKALFAAAAFVPPPPRPAKAAPVVLPPPPPPTAPPLPFTFVGKRFDSGRWEVFVNRGEQTLIVRAGQTIDANYRVDSIQPPRMVLTYLPLDEKQTLNIGGNQ
jgi:hypothetical protein